MVLYSILPPETIFGPEPREPLPCEFVLDQGPARIVARVHEGRVVVERVASTDPRHFLDARYQPGADAPALPAAPPLWG